MIYIAGEQEKNAVTLKLVRVGDAVVVQDASGWSIVQFEEREGGVVMQRCWNVDPDAGFRLKDSRIEEVLY